VHFTSEAGGTWYSPGIEVTLIHEDRKAVQVRGLYSGLVQWKGSKEEPELYNNHEPHEIYLRKGPDGSCLFPKIPRQLPIVYGLIWLEII